MTSFIINAHLGRELPPKWAQHESCAFCRVVGKEESAAIVYETDKVIAILDVLPLRRGHTLVIPKIHVSRLSELPAEFAAASGEAISKVAYALTQALDNTGLNVVCNQEYAQAVPHVHYHIIPAPKLESASPSRDVESTNEPIGDPVPLSSGDMHKMEFNARDTLDDDVAYELMIKVRAHL